MRENWKKGSFTVEASCLMGLVLFTVMGILNLFFFVHNKVWLTEAAYEAALTGSMEAVRGEGEGRKAAEEKAKTLGEVGFFGGEGLTIQVSEGKKIKAAYSLDTIPGFGGFSWKLKAEGNSLVIRPSSWIWKAKAAAETFREAAGKS